MNCELILSDGSWSMEYYADHGGTKFIKAVGVVGREEAIKEAIRQGFTIVRIWEWDANGKCFNKGTIMVPKE